MKITREMIQGHPSCEAGLDLFDKYYPSGEVEVTPDACLQMKDIAPWDWMADNLLNAKSKVRFLRVLSVQREWYETERSKVIAQLDENGLATDDMKALMADIESKYAETRAAAFCAASLLEDQDAV